MKKYDLQKRLISFSVSIIQLTEKLPRNYVGIHLGKQMTRSGTAPVLNYGEAQAAESRADFIHKMKVCLKELRETQVNLLIINKLNYVPQGKMDICSKECAELVAIFTSSISTAKENRLLNRKM